MPPGTTTEGTVVMTIVELAITMPSFFSKRVVFLVQFVHSNHYIWYVGNNGFN